MKNIAIEICVCVTGIREGGNGQFCSRGQRKLQRGDIWSGFS